MISEQLALSGGGGGGGAPRGGGGGGGGFDNFDRHVQEMNDTVSNTLKQLMAQTETGGAGPAPLVATDNAAGNSNLPENNQNY